MSALVHERAAGPWIHDPVIGRRVCADRMRVRVADHPDVTLLFGLTVFHAVGVDPVDRGADRGVMRADGPVPRLGQHQCFDPAGLPGGEGGGG